MQKPQPEEDQIAQIIEAARKDPKEFGDLYRPYTQQVFRYLFSRIDNLSEAEEDATAQTFLAALERFPNYRHDGYFASWLLSVARNKFVDRLRRAKHRSKPVEHTMREPWSDPPSQVIETERLARLKQRIHELIAEEHELLSLRYVIEKCKVNQGC